MPDNLLKPASTFIWIAVLIFITVTLQWSCSNTERTARDSAGSEYLRLYIGSYADSADAGIHLYEFLIADRKFRMIQELTGHVNPSFLALHPDGHYLYAVNETAIYRGEPSGSVTAFSIDPASGALTFINRQPSLGAHPCHISVLPNGKFAAVANYSGGNVVLLPVAGNGALEKPSGLANHEGSGPHPRRQRSAHAHSVYPLGDKVSLVAADLGIDKVLFYRIGSTGFLEPASPAPYLRMEPGAGPRHIAIHPTDHWLYVINELNSTITMVGPDPNTGRPSVWESVSTLPENFEEENFCADIRIHPSGRFLYASNRGHNSIAIFELTPGGNPVLVAHQATGGDWPRNFNIDPSGNFLFVANQRSGNITVFEIDAESGSLEKIDEELMLSQPVCIEIVPSTGARGGT
jgi:6-phosphogluconolactonase